MSALVLLACSLMLAAPGNGPAAASRALVAQGSAFAGPAPRIAADSEVARLLTTDGSAQLVLTRERLHFSFTAAGERKIERDVQESTKQQNVDSWVAELARSSALAAIRATRLSFPLDQVQDMDWSDGTLTVHFRPSGAAETPGANRNRLTLDAREADARAFIAAFHRLRRG